MDEGREFVVQVVGDGPLRPMYHHQARSLGVWDRIEWLGLLDKERPRALPRGDRLRVALRAGLVRRRPARGDGERHPGRLRRQHRLPPGHPRRRAGALRGPRRPARAGRGHRRAARRRGPAPRVGRARPRGRGGALLVAARSPARSRASTAEIYESPTPRARGAPAGRPALQPAPQPGRAGAQHPLGAARGQARERAQPASAPDPRRRARRASGAAGGRDRAEGRRRPRARRPRRAC